MVVSLVRSASMGRSNKQSVMNSMPGTCNTGVCTVVLLYSLLLGPTLTHD